MASMRTSSSLLSGIDRRKPGQAPAALHTLSTMPRDTASRPINNTQR